MLTAISIAGDWSFALDPEGRGTAERWDLGALDDTIALPGSVDRAAKAPANDAATMAHLSRRNPYVGCAWYQRQVDIPDDQAGQFHWLVLERPHGEVSVYLDGYRIGRDRSLSTEHRFFLGPLEPGAHSLTLMIDNGRFEAVGEAIQYMGEGFYDVAHSNTDHTQTNWNGVVGDMRIEAAGAAISGLRVDAPGRTIRVSAALEAFDTDRNWPDFWIGDHDDRLHMTVRLADGGEVTHDTAVGIRSGWTPVEVEIALPETAGLWSEFTPAVHVLSVEWVRDGRVLDRQETTFGIREIRSEGRHLLLNGRPLSLRGTLDCALFPKTGHPPCDRPEWRRILGVCRDHGLNHIRFHSWCPPRAAFEVADEMGIYLAVEGPVWPTLHADPNLDNFIEQEAERIFRDYGNHPSFVMFAIGNELHGAGLHAFTSRFVSHWQEADPRRVYTGGSGWPTTPEADYDSKPEPRCHRWNEGMESRLNRAPFETLTDWREHVAATEHPLLVHETGQWCVYPDFDSIDRFDGPLAARSFEMVRNDLAAKGRLDEWREIFATSGAIQVQLYKEEIEACLRTRDFVGFQLLGLQDFTGQGTALVGVVDAFWEPKSYLDSAAWREFCAPVVPLLRSPGFVVEAGDGFGGRAELAQFGADDIATGAMRWEVRDADGQTCLSGDLPHGTLAAGDLHEVGTVSVATDDLVPDRRYELVLSEPAAEARNRWPFWVMGRAAPPELPIVREIDAGVLDEVASGARLIFMPDPAEIAETSVLGWASIFWNTLWTRGQEPHTLGLRIDTEHPALNGFPTLRHNEPHWWELVVGRRAYEHAPLPGRPIVAVNDDWNANRDLALLSEVALGEGRLIISAMDVADTAERPVARSLARALGRYLEGAAAPAPQVAADAVQDWWRMQRGTEG